MMTVELPYQGVPVQIEVMPLNGLIDINSAPAPLLSKLLAAGVGRGRPACAGRGSAAHHAGPGWRGGAFDAPEDLLRVPGIDYELYAKIAALVTADLRGSGKVNPMAAPPGVLNVLSGGSSGVADRIQSARAAGGGRRHFFLDTAFVDQSPIRRFPCPRPGAAGRRRLGDCLAPCRHDGPTRRWCALAHVLPNQGFESLPARTPS
jgi:general secretion pathway protein K